MRHNKVHLLFAALVAVSAVLVLAFQALAAGQARQDDSPQVENDVLAATNCRYGVGYVPSLPTSLAWVPTLDAGWYVNFSASTWGQTVHSASFAPVIRIRQEILAGGARTDNYTVTPPLAFSFRNEQGGVQAGLGRLVSSNPGHYWLVGNEVDVNNFVQDNTMPQVYARAYHDIYTYIKKIDPTAKVAIAGLSMMTPGRLQYLSIVWDTYRSIYGQYMPVDIWNMHLYILEERNDADPLGYGDGKVALGTDPALAKLTSARNPALCPALGAADTAANDPRLDVHCRSEHDSVRIFREQVVAMRQWMKERGQQNKPLIISEFGLLYPYVKDDNGQWFLLDEHGQPFAPARVTKYLRDTIAYLETAKDPNLGYPADGNRLVQQWLWFSIVTGPETSGGSSNLINWDTFQGMTPGDPAALTMMGQAFQQAANASENWTNLAGGVGQNVVTLARSNNKGSALLTASFRNTGTLSAIAPIKVTFYSDQALTKEIGSVVYDPSVRGAVTGCAWDGRNGEQASVMWNNLSVGTHNYWAKIDTLNAVAETREDDNVTAKGTVTVKSYGAFVPMTSRQ